MAVGKRSGEKALQKVLGQGANVNADNPLEVHDPKVGSLISYEGITTADGAGDGSTLIDTVLATKADYNGNLVIITSGAYAGQGRDINGATTGGTVTPNTAFGGQILSGMTFVIIGIRTVPAEVAALTALVVALMADVGDPTGETLGSLAAKWGDIARSLDLILGARWDGAGDLGTDITTILANLATIAGYLDTEIAAILAAVDTEVASILTIVNNLPDSGALTALLASIAAILEDTGTTIPGTITTLQTTATGIQNDLDNATDGLGALKALIDAVQATANTIAGYLDTEIAAILAAVDTEVAAILEDTGTTIPGTITTLQATATGIQDDLDNATDGLGALKTLIDALQTMLTDIHDTDLPAVKADTAAILSDTGTDGVVVNTRTAAYGRLAGVLQAAATTIDLQQAAATYDLFTGTTQDLVLEKLVIRLPNVDVSDDANITSISIQTDDVTPQVVISSTDGAKANLTAEAQLGYTGVIMIKVGKKIQLTIAGGAADAATVCDVVAEYRAVVSGGYLA